MYLCHGGRGDGFSVEGIKQLGYRQFRVRHHGDLARLEVDPAELDRAASPEGRAELSRALKAAGYRWVSLDLDGYRSGSLNEVLVPATIARSVGGSAR